MRGIQKTLVFLVLLWPLANLLGLNAMIARQHVVLATYTMIVPPFILDASYDHGEIRHVSIGSRTTAVKTALQANRASCRVMEDNMLVDLQNWQGTLTNDQQIVLRCVDAGVAWNEIYEFRGDQLVQMRIAASVWM